MSKAQILEALRRMPEAERRELVETIALEFGDFDDELTPEQRAELDRRAEEFRRNPSGGLPFEKVRDEALRRLRREAVEEQLAPGESLRVTKEGGKKINLQRVHRGQADINAGLDALLAEMPAEGQRARTNLATIIIKDRE